METRKRMLGEEHPDSLTSMANLASMYRNQGRWRRPRSWRSWVMETRKRVLGEEPSRLAHEHGQPSFDAPQAGPVEGGRGA